MMLQWYSIFGYVFLLLTCMLQLMSLTILCICSRRLAGFRHSQLKVIFVCSSLQFCLRLVYEICYYSPLSDYNILCWSLRCLVEVATCCTWIRIAILAAFYYKMIKCKGDHDRKCALYVCITHWTIPIFPIIFHGIAFTSPNFFENNSCWRGQTHDTLNIIDAVDHLVLIAGTLAYLVATYHQFWYKSPDSLLNQLHHFIPNLKGKTNLLVLYIFVTVICEAEIEVRNFLKQTHDILDVAVWCINGLATSLCFCFLDTEVQRAFFAKGSHILGNTEGEGSETNLTQADSLVSTPSNLLSDDDTRNPLNNFFSEAGTISLKEWEVEPGQHAVAGNSQKHDTKNMRPKH